MTSRGDLHICLHSSTVVENNYIVFQQLRNIRIALKKLYEHSGNRPRIINYFWNQHVNLLRVA